MCHTCSEQLMWMANVNVGHIAYKSNNIDETHTLSHKQTHFNDNDKMMLMVDLVMVFMVNFAMNKMVIRVMNE